MPARRGGLAARRLRGAVSGLALLVLLVFALPWVACMGGPPRDAEDLCSIFSEKRSWHRSAKRSFQKWGVPEAVQLAIIHQESSFRASARPPRMKFLWIFPGARSSSAYGYGQVIDPTWKRYVRRTGRKDATRDDFGDVADFIGWYGDQIHRRTGVDKSDAGRLYIAYHEGPGGYMRGTHESKAWLGRVARRVSNRAGRYQQQYDVCRESLDRKRFFGLF